LIHKVKREDLVSKKVLKSKEKYYLTDHGFRQALCLCNNRDLSQVFENIVYNEMLRLGYKVTIGEIKNKEIDLICKKHDQKVYIQVTYLLDSKKTKEREFGELLKINDNFPKIVISADQFDFSQDGIKHYNIIDFLKEY
jgi:predicted AAA+ superfamily ATPase